MNYQCFVYITLFDFSHLDVAIVTLVLCVIFFFFFFDCFFPNGSLLCVEHLLWQMSEQDMFFIKLMYIDHCL